MINDSEEKNNDEKSFVGLNLKKHVPRRRLAKLNSLNKKRKIDLSKDCSIYLYEKLNGIINFILDLSNHIFNPNPDIDLILNTLEETRKLSYIFPNKLKLVLLEILLIFCDNIILFFSTKKKTNKKYLNRFVDLYLEIYSFFNDYQLELYLISLLNISKISNIIYKIDFITIFKNTNKIRKSELEKSSFILLKLFSQICIDNKSNFNIFDAFLNKNNQNIITCDINHFVCQQICIEYNELPLFLQKYLKDFLILILKYFNFYDHIIILNSNKSNNDGQWSSNNGMCKIFAIEDEISLIKSYNNNALVSTEDHIGMNLNSLEVQLKNEYLLLGKNIDGYQNKLLHFIYRENMSCYSKLNEANDYYGCLSELDIYDLIPVYMNAKCYIDSCTPSHLLGLLILEFFIKKNSIQINAEISLKNELSNIIIGFMSIQKLILILIFQVHYFGECDVTKYYNFITIASDTIDISDNTDEKSGIKIFKQFLSSNFNLFKIQECLSNAPINLDKIFTEQIFNTFMNQTFLLLDY